MYIRETDREFITENHGSNTHYVFLPKIYNVSAQGSVYVNSVTQISI